MDLEGGQVVLYKRTGSCVWQSRMKIGKGAGSWQRFSTGCKGQAEAGDVAVKRYREKIMLIKHGLSPDSRTFTHCAKIAEREMKQSLEAGTGKVIYRDYIRSLHKYMIPFFGNTHMDNIDYAKMSAFDDFRVGLLDRVPSKSVVRNHTATLNRVFEVAVLRGWMKRKNIPVIKHIYKSPERRPYFQQDELSILMDFLWHWRWTGTRSKTQEIRAILYDYFVVVYYSGIRPGTEADNIRFGDVTEYKSNNGEKFLELRIKGKTGERFISCDYMIKRAIERCRNRINGDYEDLVDDSLYIFGLVCDGGKVPKRLSSTFKKALIECNLLEDKQEKKRTLYSLRHSFATGVLIKHGTNVHLLARHMGTSINMIEAHYSHIISRNKARKLILTEPIPEHDLYDMKSVDAVKYMKSKKKSQ